MNALSIEFPMVCEFSINGKYGIIICVETGAEKAEKLTSCVVKIVGEKNPLFSPEKKKIRITDTRYATSGQMELPYDISNLKRLFPGNPLDKVELLMYYAGKSSDVSDPWYTGDFEKAYNDIKMGCETLIQELMNMI